MCWSKPAPVELHIGKKNKKKPKTNKQKNKKKKKNHRLLQHKLEAPRHCFPSLLPGLFGATSTLPRLFLWTFCGPRGFIFVSTDFVDFFLLSFDQPPTSLGRNGLARSAPQFRT